VREKKMRDRCVTAEITSKDGVSWFSGTLTDGLAPLLEIKLQTGSEKQAAILKRRFEKDAEAILERVWGLLTDSKTL
jgi:hypothetical protein